MLETFQHSALLEVGDHGSAALQRLTPFSLHWSGNEVNCSSHGCLSHHRAKGRQSKWTWTGSSDIMSQNKPFPLGFVSGILSQNRKSNPQTYTNQYVRVSGSSHPNALIKFIYFHVFSYMHVHWNRYHSICVEIYLLGSAFAFHHAELGLWRLGSRCLFPPRHRSSLHSFEVFIINFLFLREGTHVCRFSLKFVQVTHGYHTTETDHLVFDTSPLSRPGLADSARLTAQQAPETLLSLPPAPGFQSEPPCSTL